MKAIRFFTIFLAALFVFGSQANAAGKGSGMLLQLTPSLSSLEVTSGGSTTKGSSTSADITIGYLMNMGLALGLRYSMSNTSSESGGVTTTGTVSYYGPAIGYYHDGGFFGLFSYLMNYSSSNGTTTVTGDGMQFDLGYIYRMGTFGLGAELSYMTLAQKKSTTAGVETTIDNKSSGYVVPQIVFNWIF
jgi:hypothetical protein